MKICVVGAGSIGGLLGVKLALAGHEVTLIARGAHCQANRSFFANFKLGGFQNPLQTP